MWRKPWELRLRAVDLIADLVADSFDSRASLTLVHEVPVSVPLVEIALQQLLDTHLRELTIQQIRIVKRFNYFWQRPVRFLASESRCSGQSSRGMRLLEPTDTDRSFAMRIVSFDTWFGKRLSVPRL